MFEAIKHPNTTYTHLGLHCIDSLMHKMGDEHLDSLRMSMIDVDASVSYHDSCVIEKYDAFLRDSNIRSMLHSYVDPWHVKFNIGGVYICISSLPIYNPLEKGGLFYLVDKDMLERMFALMMDDGLLMKEDLFDYTSQYILDWKSRWRHIQGKCALQENFHHMALSAPTLLDEEDLLYLALSGGTTNTERWSKFTPWTNTMKGHNLDSFHDSHSISISYDVPSKHVYF